MPSFDYPGQVYSQPVRPSAPASRTPYSPPNPPSLADVIVLVKILDLSTPAAQFFSPGFEKFDDKYFRYYRTILFEQPAGSTDAWISTGRLFAQRTVDIATGDREYTGGGTYSWGPTPPPGGFPNTGDVDKDQQIRHERWVIDEDGTLHSFGWGYLLGHEGDPVKAGDAIESVSQVDTILGLAGSTETIDETTKGQQVTSVFFQRYTLSDLVDWHELTIALEQELNTEPIDNFPFGVSITQKRAFAPVLYGGPNYLDPLNDSYDKAQKALDDQQETADAAEEAFNSAQIARTTARNALNGAANALIAANAQRERALAAQRIASTPSEKSAAEQLVAAALANEQAQRDIYNAKLSAHGLAVGTYATTFRDFISAQRKLDDAERNLDYWGTAIDLIKKTVADTAEAKVDSGIWYHEVSFSSTAGTASNDTSPPVSFIAMASRTIALQDQSEEESGNFASLRTGRYMLRMRIPPHFQGTFLPSIDASSFWAYRPNGQDFEFRWSEVTTHLKPGTGGPNTAFPVILFGSDFDDQQTLPASVSEWKVDSSEFDVAVPANDDEENKLEIGLLGPNSYANATLTVGCIRSSSVKLGFLGYRVDGIPRIFGFEAIQMPDGTRGTHHIDPATLYEIWDNENNEPNVPVYSHQFPGSPITNPDKPTAESPSSWVWRDGKGVNEQITTLTLSQEDTTASLLTRVQGAVNASGELDPVNNPFGDPSNSGALVAGRHLADDETYVLLANGMYWVLLDIYQPWHEDRNYSVVLEKTVIDPNTMQVSKQDLQVNINFPKRTTSARSAVEVLQIPGSNQLIFVRLKRSAQDTSLFFSRSPVCDAI